jgi:competence ComEA-like helix-hairpin-helix protein
MILPRFLYRLLVLVACFVFPFFVSSLAAKKKPPTQPVNLNTATSEQLQLVPGIGPATADKILKVPKSYGPFKSVDDLLAIRGLGPTRLEKMRKYLITGKSATPKPAVTNCAVCTEATTFLRASTGQTVSEIHGHRVWWVGRPGASMRRGTWSAMRMP